MTRNFRVNVMTLCAKVQEVLDNNDWPTEEGQNRADDPPCRIQVLINSVLEELE
jgi:hypothetical protein